MPVGVENSTGEWGEGVGKDMADGVETVAREGFAYIFSWGRG